MAEIPDLWKCEACGSWALQESVCTHGVRESGHPEPLRRTRVPIVSRDRYEGLKQVFDDMCAEEPKLEADLAQALAERDRLLEALRQIEVDAKQMKGLGMREEAAETFDLIERTASAAIREGK